jgi:ABC-2 type transport system permease protein
MRKILRIAEREYLATVRTKGFIIGLVLAPILMGGGALALFLLRNQVDTRDRQIVLLDRSGVLAPALIRAATERNAKEVYDEKTGKKTKPAYLLQEMPPEEGAAEAQRLELSGRVRGGSLHAFLEIGADIVTPPKEGDSGKILYYAKNAALDDIRRWLNGPINEELRQLRLRRAGIDPAKVPHLFQWLQAEPMGLLARDSGTGEVSQPRRSSEAEAVLIPMIATVLMFLLLMMGTASLLQAVMEEKSQRIAEVMLGAAKPFELMMGKVLGGVAVALTGSLVYVLGTIVALQLLAQSQFIPYQLLPWFFAYLIGACFLFGALQAGLGALCSDAKDAQSLQLPAMLPMMIPMFLLGPVFREPNSAVAVVASLLPPFTPTLMVLRQAMPGGVPLWQPMVGLIGVIACALLTVWASSRIYRIGILMQGKPPRLTEIVRFAIRG